MKATPAQITASRLKLGNPHAHLDDEGGYSALATEPPATPDPGARMSTTKDQAEGGNPGVAASSLNNSSPSATALRKHLTRLKRTPTDRELEQWTNEFLNLLWIHRNEIWDNALPINALDVLDPRKALEFLGYRITHLSGLEQFIERGNTFETAGVIDSSSRTIWISDQFADDEQKFTLAHELGHALLHSHANIGLHRDRPVTAASSSSQNTMERQADRFAVKFLMPSKQMARQLHLRFGATPIELNEQTRMALGESNIGYMEKTSKFEGIQKAFALTIARTQNFGMHQFPSLAESFGVSPSTMAIRLLELNLISSMPHKQPPNWRA